MLTSLLYFLARGLLELEKEFSTTGEAKADEAAVNKGARHKPTQLAVASGVGRVPLAAGIPFQVA